VTIIIDPTATNHPFDVWDYCAQGFVTKPGEYTVTWVPLPVTLDTRPRSPSGEAVRDRHGQGDPDRGVWRNA
jgi:hypothetical protein